MTEPQHVCLWKDACPLAGLCKRIAEEPENIRQSFFAPTEIGKDCKYFIDATPKDKEKA